MTSLRIERRLPVAPERVWAALTDPAALAAWFWPASFGTVVHADPRVGGAFRIAATSGLAVAGEYVVVEPPARLAFTWRWDGEADATFVSIELSAMDGGTDLVLLHDRFPDDTTRDNHLVGWSECLDRLPGHLDARAAQG